MSLARVLPLLLLLGCGGAAPPAMTPAVPAVPDEDLLGLLPSGMQLVIDVDVEQLRRWPTTARLRQQVPASIGARLERLGIDPLRDLDLLVAGIAVDGAATKDELPATLTVLARGRLDEARLRAALGPEAVAEEYHGRTVVSGLPIGGERAAWAMLTKRTAALGGRTEVRRAVDVLQGGDEGLRRSKPDTLLVTALGRAPSAAEGRPAIIAALRVDPPLRERAIASGVAPESLEGLQWVSGALAVGDGFEVGFVAGARDGAAAELLLARVKWRLEELKAQSFVRLLQLGPFIDGVKLVRKNGELHIGFGLVGTRFAVLLDKVELLLRLSRGEKVSR